MPSSRQPKMYLPSVVYFDAQSLLDDDSSVSSTPTILPSAASDNSVCASDVSTAATSVGDVSVPSRVDSKPQCARPHLTKGVPPPPTQSKPMVRNGSTSVNLEDALLWRPLHVLPDTHPPPKFCMNTPLDSASTRPTMSHKRALQAQSHRPDDARVHESGIQRPHGIDSSRFKDLPELPTKQKKRGWGALGRTFSHLIHRQPKESSPVPRDRSTPPLRTSNASLEASSSTASFISGRPRRSSSKGSPPTSHTPHKPNENKSQAHLRKQQLRRSRSFSGYPDVINITIADEHSHSIYPYPTAREDGDKDGIAREGFAILREVAKAWNMEPLCDDEPLIEDPGEMDQMAQEAFEMLGEVHKTWRFSPLNEDDPAFAAFGAPRSLFKRGRPVQ